MDIHDKLHSKRQNASPPSYQPSPKRQDVGQHGGGSNAHVQPKKYDKEEIKKILIDHGNRSTNYVTNKVPLLHTPAIGNQLYHVARPPPNANIRQMSLIVNGSSARPQGIQYTLAPNLLNSNNYIIKSAANATITPTTVFPVPANINGSRMHVNASGNKLHANIVGVPCSTSVGNVPRANVVRMPYNVVNNPVNRTPVNTFGNRFVHPVLGNAAHNVHTNIRTSSNNLTNSFNAVNQMSANRVANTLHANVVRTPGNLPGNLSSAVNPIVLNAIQNLHRANLPAKPSNVVNHIPGNVVRNTVNVANLPGNIAPGSTVNAANIRTIQNALSALNRIPVNVARSPVIRNVAGNQLYPVPSHPTSRIIKPIIPSGRHLVNPVQIRPPARVVAPLQYISPRNIPVIRQNTPIFVRHNTMPTLVKHPMMGPGLHTMPQRIVQNNFRPAQYIPSQNAHHGNRNKHVTSTVFHSQKDNPGNGITKITKNDKNHELLETTKAKPWFDNECHILHEKRQKMLTSLRKAIKEENQNEIEELSKKIEEINSEYIPLTTDKLSKYVTDLETKGELGLICEIVVASVVGEVDKHLKIESIASESSSEETYKSVYSYESLRDILTNEDLEEIEYGSEDDCVGEDLVNTEEVLKIEHNTDRINESENDVDISNVDMKQKELSEVACIKDKVDIENTEEVESLPSKDGIEREEKQIELKDGNCEDGDISDVKMDEMDMSEVEDIGCASDKNNIEGEIKAGEKGGYDGHNIVCEDEDVKTIGACTNVDKINASIKEETCDNIGSSDVADISGNKDSNISKTLEDVANDDSNMDSEIPKTSVQDVANDDSNTDSEIPKTSVQDVANNDSNTDSEIPKTSVQDLANDDSNMDSEIPETSVQDVANNDSNTDSEFPKTSVQDLANDDSNMDSEISKTSEDVANDDSNMDSEIPKTSVQDVANDDSNMDSEVPKTSDEDVDNKENEENPSSEIEADIDNKKLLEDQKITKVTSKSKKHSKAEDSDEMTDQEVANKTKGKGSETKQNERRKSGRRKAK